ncbi:MAG: SH3 domain-containing protein [Gammaproteobacteria bacterium]
MNKAILIVALACCCLGANAYGKRAPYIVEVADPYIELHTGPGKGFPIFHVVERGETVEVHTRRTDWFKISTARDIEGWVSAAQLSNTLNPDGSPTEIQDPDRDDYVRRNREFGFQLGDFDGASIITAYGAYLFTDNLSVELSASDITGDFSSGWMLGVDLLHQPFPSWIVSPFFALGTGILSIEPKTTLVQAEDRRNQQAHVRFGLRSHLGRRFLLRAEYTSYVVFTKRDSNEELDAWTAGFSFFF